MFIIYYNTVIIQKWGIMYIHKTEEKYLHKEEM